MIETSSPPNGTQNRRAKPGALRVVSEPLRKFFTPVTLADYLSVSERTVRQLLIDGEIESFMVGGSRRVDPVDVDAYLSRRRQRRR
jgi:excisionase family DNA binding protein